MSEAQEILDQLEREEEEELLLEEETPEPQLASREDMTPVEAEKKAETIEEKKARIAQVLSQGVVGHALQNFAETQGMWYAFVRENDTDISRFTQLGYRVATDVGKGMHGTGDGKYRIGDVILMEISLEDHMLIEEVKVERNKRKMDSPIKEYKERALAASQARGAAPPIDLMEDRGGVL